ncbi:CAP domain-containing protein [Levilactobacillus suantsaiihabitans]|uniref:CAP domain-containing protein n=1 Tax=Levilactobacillus suantsaiihabitans TaxID=2487722 RepID=A0A4Z0JDQ8_9LACO|nr:CAP domain-containing protein [Levilactobacillus suantsaiihabitans]TGD19476.1 CAP domain-containing protein [Levilactobacillus suantsaiihabitans]
MSKLTKLIAIMAASAGVAGGIITTTNPINASAATKFRYYKNIKNHAYKVTNKKAVIYTNGKIKHKTGAKLGQYGKYVTGYYASHVTVNGHKKVYYKFKTASGHTGWVWHGWLKKVSNKKVSVNTNSNKPLTGSAAEAANGFGPSDFERLSKGKRFKMNISEYRQGFLDTVNAERAKRGISALKQDTGLNQVAMQRDLGVGSTSIGSHYTADGRLAAKVLAEKIGINYVKSETLGMDAVNMISHGLNSDEDIDPNTNLNTVIDSAYNAGKARALAYIYDDADSDWGHRDILLNSAYNVIGIGSHAIHDNTVATNAAVLGTK